MPPDRGLERGEPPPSAEDRQKRRFRKARRGVLSAAWALRAVPLKVTHRHRYRAAASTWFEAALPAAKSGNFIEDHQRSDNESQKNGGPSGNT